MRKPDRRKAPVGFLKPDFEGLQQAGCIQADMRPLFIGLYAATQGNICNGCPVWQEQGPECKAYQQYHSEALSKAVDRHQRIVQAVFPCDKNGDKWHGYSVSQIAQELNISKSEVRRRKLAGTL